MANRTPPDGVIPAGRPSLAAKWRDRQARNAAFSHLRNLIGILSTVDGGLLMDPNFLERSLLVDGVTARTSPKDRLESFPLLSPRAAVAVRDCEAGHRVGLVVFSNADDSATAMNLVPRRGFYAFCVPASRRGDSRMTILDAFHLQRLRSHNAMLLRSLVPPQYLVADDEMDLHLRCVFLGGAARVSGGAYGVCRIVRDELLPRGPVLSVIMDRARDAAVLVFDDAETVELVAKRATRLLPLGVVLFDSFLFPLPVDVASREAEAALLPHIVTGHAFMSRVLRLAGLDTEHCDASEITDSTQSRLDLICEDHTVEAVIVHRCQKLVFVVLGSSQAAEVLLNEPPDVWTGCFGRPIAWVGAFEGCPRVQQQHPETQLHITRIVGALAFHFVMNKITSTLRRMSLGMGETWRLPSCLIALCALENPNVVQARNFSDRALFLSGVDSSLSDGRISYFGPVDELVLDMENMKAALVVFKSSSGVERLLLLSAEA